MCGLIAIHRVEGGVSMDSLRAGLERLAHRGPDGLTYWLPAHGRIGLGHARLSIMDLANGVQPVATGGIHAITNGEFYGFEEIREELRRQGHCLHTDCDAEILPHLYRAYGRDCLRWLRGEFAFVLWDDARQTLFAARDRFGVKPLYYTEHGRALLLASEVKGLFAAGVPARWNETSVYQQLFACLGGNETLFSGVRQVPPGHCLFADTNGVRVERYWDIDYPDATDIEGGGADAEYEEIFGAALRRALKIRLRADVPIAGLLSGGIDSSSLLGLSVETGSRPVCAHTLSYRDSEFDEAGIAANTARYLGVEHRVLAPNGNDYAQALACAIIHGESMTFNLHGVARYLHCRSIRASGDICILSGEGADELLGGYGFSRHDLAPRQATPLAVLAGVARELGFVPDWLTRLAVERSLTHLVLSRDFAERFAEFNPYDALLQQHSPQQWRNRAPLHISLYLWNRSVLPNYILLSERLEMASAVEVRLPFLDHHLFDVAKQLPFRLLRHNGQEKYLLRRVVRSVLPAAVRERPKQPFTAPPALSYGASTLPAVILERLRGSAMRQVPFFSEEGIETAVKQWICGEESLRPAWDSLVLALFSACVLQEEFALS